MAPEDTVKTGRDWTARDWTGRDWTASVFLAVICVYFYVFMEWLFFVTKPSFMTVLGPLDALHVLLVTPLPLAAAAAVVVTVLWLPAVIVRNRLSRTVSSAAALAIPAAVLAAAFFLMVDNFTYTIFHFGVGVTLGYERLAYVLLIAVLAAISYRFLHGLKKSVVRSLRRRALVIGAPCLLLVSILCILVRYDHSVLASIGKTEASTLPADRPNVILLASDGLNAENLSVYGYERETTPFLKSLAESALLCENCFTNAGSSGGSIASLFTGKLPTVHRLIYPPDILRGKNAYQHLPGILRNYGYRNIDFSTRHYADPCDLNLRNAFDRVNNRDVRENHLFEYLLITLGQESFYLLQKMQERITERLFHTFNVRQMRDPLADVYRSNKDRRVKSWKAREIMMQGVSERKRERGERPIREIPKAVTADTTRETKPGVIGTDKSRKSAATAPDMVGVVKLPKAKVDKPGQKGEMKQKKIEVLKPRKSSSSSTVNALFSFIDASPAPFFAHLHLLGTHGPIFYTASKRFSAGRSQKEHWATDFYDDAIRDFDDTIEEIIERLKERGILDKTVIVINTDHGQRFRVNERIPLIFLFPNGEHSGRIAANVQNLDIAPTILDYLGIAQPDWMSGQSLISAGIDNDRFVFTVDRRHGDVEKRTKEGWELDVSKTGPPFYSLGAVGVFYHQKFYDLDLIDNSFTVTDIKGHTSPCGEGDIPDPDLVRQMIVDHLASNGYDVSSIKTPSTERTEH